MKRFLTALLALFAALLLPGCLQNETTITLKKDGSGTLVETTTLGPQVLAMLDQFAALAGPDAGNPLDEAFSEAKAKARAKAMGEGVAFVKSERVNHGHNEGARVTYTFADISKLKVSPADAMNDISPAGAQGKKPKQKPVTFAYADSKLTVTMPEPDMTEANPDGAAAEQTPEMEQMMKKMLGDMTVALKIVAASGIAETDATYRDGDTVTLIDMEMAKILEKPEVLKKLMSADQKDPAATMAVLKGVDGVKMETKPKIEVTLK